MSRSIRTALVISIIVGAAIYVTIQRGKTLRASRALRQVPSTARIVLAIDPSAVARSASASALLRWFIGDEQLSEIELRCGLDPMRDLREIVLWVRGSERAPFEAFGLSLEGRTVDASALTECHRLIVDDRGGSIVRLDAPSGPLLASEDRRSAIALVGPDTVVTGAVKTVAEAMAVRDGRLPALEEREEVARLWRLEGIRVIAVSAKEGSTPTLELFVKAVSIELALRHADIIRAWAASPPEGIESPWLEVFRSAEVRVDGTQVVTTLDLAELAALGPPH